MDEQQTAVLRLRAEGRSYRQIAAQLGIPLTRAYTLAQQAVGPDPEPESESESPPAPEAPPPPATRSTGREVTNSEEGPTPVGDFVGDLPAGMPAPVPHPGYLTEPYTMPGPRGTVIVVYPAGAR